MKERWANVLPITLSHRGLPGQNYIGPTAKFDVDPTYRVSLCQRWANEAVLSGLVMGGKGSAVRVNALLLESR